MNTVEHKYRDGDRISFLKNTHYLDEGGLLICPSAEVEKAVGKVCGTEIFVSKSCLFIWYHILEDGKTVSVRVSENLVLEKESS